jgi:GxxExxY protein
MHKNYERADGWSWEVIGAAIEVHRQKGPGLLEEIYQKCLMRELELRRVPSESQMIVPIEYKGLVFDQPLKLDVYVDRCLLLELKAVECILPVHKAQLMSYMKLMDAPIGLLINFHEVQLKDGISRLILPEANSTGLNAGPRR